MFEISGHKGLVSQQIKDNVSSTIYFQTETWTHLTDIPEEHFRYESKVCCVEGNIYLVGGAGGGDRRVTEYNTWTKTWRNMPRLQKWRRGHNVCTLDNKIFVLGDDGVGTTCEMLDMSDDDPQWRYIAKMNRGHFGGGTVVIERNIYRVSHKKCYLVLEGCSTP